MSALLLATLLQTAVGDMTLAQPGAHARSDEADLQGDLETSFFAQKDRAFGRSLVACGTVEAREAAGIMLVMRLNAHRQVTKTWLSKPSPLGQCFEERMRSEILQLDGRAELYTFVNFNF